MHTLNFVDGAFMVALAQSTYLVQEDVGEVSVCVMALSSTAMLTDDAAVVVRTESRTATETGMYRISLVPIHPGQFPAFHC